MDIVDIDNDLIDDDYDDLLELDNIYGIPRRIYERANLFLELNDFEFFVRFRLTKNTILNFLPHIEEQLEYPYDM